MYSNNSNRRRASWAGGLGIVLAMGLGLAASPAEAQPFAYVTTPNSSFNSVTVIDTATNMPVTTIPVGSGPFGVAVTPDGKHVYVTDHDSFPANVTVIDTATNMVVTTIGAGSHPFGVAISPDGKTAYVANERQHHYGDQHGHLRGGHDPAGGGPVTVW